MTNHTQYQTREARKAAQQQQPPAKPPKKPVWRRVIRWILLGLVAIVLFGAGLFVYYAKDAPTLSKDKLVSGGSLVLLASNGKQLTRVGSENRSYVDSDQIPQRLKDAVTSIEDHRFYKQPLGVDPIRIVGSALYNLTHPNSSPQGGSTLTQQLIKLAYFSTSKKDQTLRRKAQEAWLAVQANHKFSKEDIMEFYVNKVFMANGIYGMGTAADFYFGKDLDQLSIAQTALIAGITNAPSYYDPYVHPEAAKQRRDLVIQAMLDNDKISSQEAQKAKATPITSGLQTKQETNSDEDNAVIADAYIQEVVKQVRKKGYNPYQDNLTVKTNLNYQAQKYLYELVNSNQIAFPDDKMQTGVTVVDPNNGHVIAMIGNRKVGKVQLALNQATQTDRSNGSTMKPLLDYAPAIEYLSWPTNYTLADTPYTYPGTDIALNNWDDQFMGNISMRTALKESRNIPAIRTLETVGLSKASQFVSNLGIKIPNNAGLSVGIGADLSSLQVAAAYSAFANGGTYYQPKYIQSITTADRVVHKYQDDDGQQAMKASTAYMITDMLKDVIKSGSGTQAQIAGLYQAGKTGTTGYTDDELAKNSALNNTVKDAWFTGFTKHYSIAVWTGYPKAQENGVPRDGSIAMQIYQKLMSYLSQNVSNTDWSKPSSVVRRGNELYVANSSYEPDEKDDEEESSSSSSSSEESSSSESTSEETSSQSTPSESQSDDETTSSDSSTSDSTDTTTSSESSSTSSSTDQNNNAPTQQSPTPNSASSS